MCALPISLTHSVVLRAEEAGEGRERAAEHRTAGSLLPPVGHLPVLVLERFDHVAELVVGEDLVDALERVVRERLEEKAAQEANIIARD